MVNYTTVNKVYYPFDAHFDSPRLAQCLLRVTGCHICATISGVSMIDLALLREDPKKIIALIAKKEPDFDAELLYDLDTAVRLSKTDVEALRHKKNELAEQGKKGVTPELREQSIEIGKKLKEKEAQLKDQEEAFKKLYLQCPNLLQSDIPSGNKESNKIIREWGKKPQLSGPVKNHVELGFEQGWFDFEAAATMTGSNFVVYKEPAVKLMYALTMFMLKHNGRHGYQYMLLPYLVNEKSLEIASNFPKFRDQVYDIAHDNLYLSPTAEVNLSNLYRDTIFSKDELPKRFTAWTSCFRREAGAYGATERGLIRIHQFEKVELYAYCKPEDSETEQQKMLACAEEILQLLGLHYRVMLLAAQDTSFPSAKTYDIEVWMPGQDAYYEVSSVSNCSDFQARRGGMRYREAEGAKPVLVHTLNGSSLALPRLMVAIMETFAQPDGTIVIPEILMQYGVY